MLLDLPSDCLLNILSVLDIPSRGVLSCCCKHLGHACSHPSLWRTVVLQESDPDGVLSAVSRHAASVRELHADFCTRSAELAWKVSGNAVVRFRSTVVRAEDGILHRDNFTYESLVMCFPNYTSFVSRSTAVESMLTASGRVMVDLDCSEPIQVTEVGSVVDAVTARAKNLFINKLQMVLRVWNGPLLDPLYSVHLLAALEHAPRGAHSWNLWFVDNPSELTKFNVFSFGAASPRP